MASTSQGGAATAGSPCESEACPSRAPPRRDPGLSRWMDPLLGKREVVAGGPLHAEVPSTSHDAHFQHPRSPGYPRMDPPHDGHKEEIPRSARPMLDEVPPLRGPPSTRLSTDFRQGMRSSGQPDQSQAADLHLDALRVFLQGLRAPASDMSPARPPQRVLASACHGELTLGHQAQLEMTALRRALRMQWALEAAEDDTSASEADEDADVIVGPTNLAVMPSKLEALFLPDLCGGGPVVPVGSSSRCLRLSDTLRLSRARSGEAPLSFGSVLHLNYGAGQPCRPCMFERWAGRCNKSWLCDFCHLHTVRPDRSGVRAQGARTKARP